MINSPKDRVWCSPISPLIIQKKRSQFRGRGTRSFNEGLTTTSEAGGSGGILPREILILEQRALEILQMFSCVIWNGVQYISKENQRSPGKKNILWTELLKSVAPPIPIHTQAPYAQSLHLPSDEGSGADSSSIFGTSDERHMSE